MIKPIEYGDYLWTVRFRYVPNREACKAQGGPKYTYCTIMPKGIKITPQGDPLAPVPEARLRILQGSAVCHPKDKPDYELGRRAALRKALDGTIKDFRRAVWQAYLGRKQNLRSLPDGWYERIIRLRQLVTELADILDRCQDAMGRYLPPDGTSADQAISELLGVLDCSPTVQALNRAREEGARED